MTSLRRMHHRPTVPHMVFAFSLIILICPAAISAQSPSESFALAQVIEIFEDTQARRHELSRSEQIMRYDQARDILEPLIESGANHADLWYWQAAIIGSRGEARGILAAAMEVSQVIDCLERCIELDPNHADAWATLARVHNALPGFMGGDRDMAVAAGRRALAISLDSDGDPGMESAETAEYRAVLARALWRRNEEGDRGEAQTLKLLTQAWYGVPGRESIPERIAEDLAPIR
jgi:tetratricopeptide (TPR) repeat protein